MTTEDRKRDLIEQAAKAIWIAKNEITDEAWADAAWAELTAPDDWNHEALDAMDEARAALAVFEAAQKPTDDEREALIRYEAWHEGYAARIDGKSASEGPGHPLARSRSRRTDTATRQGEPTDAQVRAAWDALGPRRTVHLEYEDLQVALRAAAATQEGENR